MIEYSTQTKENLLLSLNIKKDNTLHAIVYTSFLHFETLHKDIDSFSSEIKQFIEQHNVDYFYGIQQKNYVSLLLFCLENKYIYDLNFDKFVHAIKNLPKRNDKNVELKFIFHIFSNIVNENTSIEYLEQYLIDSELQNERFVIHI